MSLAQLPGYFSVAWLIEHLGRKKILVAYLLGTMLSAYLFGVAESANELLLYGALLSFFNLGAWGVMYAYTPEQYPTRIRATGAGVAASVGRVGGIFGPLTVGYLVAAQISIRSLFTLFAFSLLVAIIAVILLGRETKQMKLID
ncbi:MAG: MFS transporter, partial [Saezia sp.]